MQQPMKTEGIFISYSEAMHSTTPSTRNNFNSLSKYYLLVVFPLRDIVYRRYSNSNSLFRMGGKGNQLTSFISLSPTVLQASTFSIHGEQLRFPIHHALWSNLAGSLNKVFCVCRQNQVSVS